MNRKITIVLAGAIVVIVGMLGYTLVQEMKTRSTLTDMWQKLGQDDPKVFGQAREICDKDLNRAIPVLVKATVDSSATRRRNAVDMLASFAATLKDKERSATDAIVQRLDDRDASVRAAASIALTAEFHYKGAIAKLEAIADGDSDITTRRAALTALGYVAGDGEVLFLAAKLKNAAPNGPEQEKETELIKSAASHALGLTGRADALMILLGQLKEKASLAIQAEQLLSVGNLAGDLNRGSEPMGTVIKALDDYRAGQSMDALLIQAMAGPVDPALSQKDKQENQDDEIRAVLGALLQAYRDWGAGKEVDFFFEKIKSAQESERELYQDVVHDYIASLMQTGTFVSGRNIQVVADISDEDSAVLLDICGKLVDLLGSNSRQFALENLNFITRLNITEDVLKGWQEQYRKWSTGAEKFKVQPRPEENPTEE